MKTMLFVVLAVVTAASTLTAQDTLRFDSYKIVDVCSSERRWLLAVNVGNIKPTDSLVSFDITIGYNKNLLLPTDVLKEGTLSANMAYPPGLNTVVPNEMRVSGGNIIKPVFGDLPLVAISGEFLGACTDFDTLGYPWPATFNEEFKKKYTVVQRNQVIAEAKAKKLIRLGYLGLQDTVELKSDSTSTLTTTFVGQLWGDSVFVLNLKYDTSKMDVQIAASNKIQVLGSIHTTSGSSFTLHHSDGEPNVIVNIVPKVVESELKSILQISTSMSQTCSCVLPANVDSVVVRFTKPIVSVSSSDVYIDGIRIDKDILSIQCNHETMKKIGIYSLTGVNVYSAEIGAEQRSFSCSFLPSGPYLVRCICGDNYHANLILK